MRKNNINTEFIFSLFLKFYPEALSILIGFNIENIKLEKNCFGRRIDAYTKIGRKEIFIENQLGRSDEMHLKQVNIIINGLSKNKQAIVIWIAKSFDSNMINAVVNKIKKNNKNIEFLAIELSDGIAEELNKLRFTHEFEIIDSLNKVYLKSQENNMEVVFRYYKKYTEIESKKRYKEKRILTEKHKVMEEILAGVKEQLYYFPTVHRQKKAGNIIVLGAGISDVDYNIGVNNDDYIFVCLRFHSSQKEIFNLLYQNKEEVEDKLDYLIDWDLEFFKIYSECKYFENQERVIRRQVRILDKLVKFFTKYRETLDE